MVNFTIAGVMISLNIQDWTSSPVVTSIDTTVAPNSEIDFPAITACEEMPSHRESWEVPSLILDSIEFLNCDSDECDESTLNETKSVFGDFVEELIDKHLEYNYTDSKWKTEFGGADCPSDCFANYLFVLFILDECTAKCERIPTPGGFDLPEGYNGLSHGMLSFNTAYCDLAKEVAHKRNSQTDSDFIQEIKSRWVNAIISSKNFNVDTLASEFGVLFDFESSTFNDHFVSPCKLDDNQKEVMRFLAKIYLLDPDVIFKRLGTTLRLLVWHGKLNIQPYSNGKWVHDSESGVTSLRATGNRTCNSIINYENCSSGCVFESKEDIVFHGILQKVAGEEMSTAVSLFDLPTLYQQQIPTYSSLDYFNHPVHTLCQEDSKSMIHVQYSSNMHGQVETNCTTLWKDYVLSGLTNNPYELDEEDSLYTCGKGLGNTAS